MIMWRHLQMQSELIEEHQNILEQIRELARRLMQIQDQMLGSSNPLIPELTYQRLFATLSEDDVHVIFAGQFNNPKVTSSILCHDPEIVDVMALHQEFWAKLISLPSFYPDPIGQPRKRFTVPCTSTNS